ncbi:unnamed protein product [Orchesella dallaii]|uniref:C2H2-type domain-containing protein n=1 Tax=Orchesella dallaii TaxID=48710 RepID=A0ABP1RZW3_9HEXA
MDSISESFCIFCYKCTPIPVKQNEVKKQPTASSTKFILQITRYLNIRLNKKEYDFINKLSSLESPICEDCSKLGSSFSHLYSQWECIILQLNWQVKRFCDILKCSDKVTPTSTALRKKTCKDGLDFLSMYIDIQFLRKEIVTNSDLKVKSHSQPRVNLTGINRNHSHFPVQNETFSLAKDESGAKENACFDNRKVQSARPQLLHSDCDGDVQDEDCNSGGEAANSLHDQANEQEMDEFPPACNLKDESGMNSVSSHCNNRVKTAIMKTGNSSLLADDTQATSSHIPEDKKSPRQTKKSLRALLKCIKCSKTFTNQFNLDAHIKSHDENSNDNSGLEDFNDDNNDHNYRINSDKDFEVQDGTEESNTIEDEQRTMNKHNEASSKTRTLSVNKGKRATEKRKFPCIVCRKLFSHRASLYRHKRNHNNMNNSLQIGTHMQRQTEGNVLPMQTRSQFPITNPVSCDICGRKFASQNSLNVHKNYHAKCEIEKINKMAALGTEGESSASIEPFPETQCGICKQIFNCRAAVQKHRVVEHNLPFYVDCQNCGQLYSDHVHFYRHRQRRTNDDPKCFTDDPELLKPAITSLFPYRRKPKGKKFCPHEGCYEVFQAENLVNIHLKTHGKWNCQFCSKEFSKAHEMAWHEIGHKTEIQGQSSNPSSIFNAELDTLKYACTRCDQKGFTKRRVIWHILNQHLNIFGVNNKKCPICMKIFYTTHALNEEVINKHIKEWHSVEGMDTLDVFKCNLCNAPFVKERFLVFHMKQVHKTAPIEEAGCSTGATQSKKLKCPTCDREYKTRGAVRTHMREVHKQESGSGLPGDFPCDICGERFLEQHNLNFHNRKVHLKVPCFKKNNEAGAFKCEICGKTYPSRIRLHLHIKFIHTPPKKVHCCETCGKVYKKLDQLQKHIRFVHMDRSTWKFVCSEEGCGKRLFSNQRLTDHIRTHTKEAPYLCYLCGGAFRYRQYLRTHLVKVHGPAAANALPAHTYNKPYDQIMREKQAAEDVADSGDCGMRDTGNP